VGPQRDHEAITLVDARLHPRLKTSHRAPGFREPLSKRTREGMKVAKAHGRLRGKQPKLKPNQAKHLLELHDLGT
jgi:hypothetical protein